MIFDDNPFFVEYMNEKHRKELDDISTAMLGCMNRLETLEPELTLFCDKEATQRILTDLKWAVENCAVMALHQVGEAMNDTMGYDFERIRWADVITQASGLSFVHNLGMGTGKWSNENRQVTIKYRLKKKPEIEINFWDGRDEASKIVATFSEKKHPTTGRAHVVAMKAAEWLLEGKMPDSHN